MTTSLSTWEVSKQISEHLPGAISETTDAAILVNSEALLEVAVFLKNASGLDFDYLTTITAVDYYQYFEVVYLFVSMEHNHSLVLKVRCHDRDNPTLPSLVSLWRSADHAKAAAEAMRLTAADLLKLGVVDEVLQTFVGRDCELGDWVADVIGASIGLACFHLIVQRRRRH